jgi:hypothetical protein
VAWTRSARLVTAAVAAAALAGPLSGAFGQSSDACTLTGSATGTSGRDVICGTTGQDVMQSLGGDDELRGGRGPDFLHGGTGKDLLLGDTGNDLLRGNTGFDALFGGPNDDDLGVRDGELDQVNCGSGLDRLDADLVDFAASAGGFLFFVVGCEGVTVGAVDEGPNVSISDRPRVVGDDGRTSVRLRCPASLSEPSRCTGTLRLQLAVRGSLRRSAPQTRYSLRPGVTAWIRVRLSDRDRHSLRRSGRAAGVATSVEQGEHGDKTTVERVRLKTPA